jgi:hypothetical protein
MSTQTKALIGIGAASFLAATYFATTEESISAGVVLTALGIAAFIFAVMEGEDD